MKKSFEYSDKIQAVILPEQNEPVEDETYCMITGWGRTSSGHSSWKLRIGYVPTVNQEKCVDVYKSVHEVITENMLCAGYEKGGIDACQGES